MNEREREEFLQEFQAQGEKTLLGFCVMGGIFSEGIDLIGDRLIGVAVIGTGIPQIGCRIYTKQFHPKLSVFAIQNIRHIIFICQFRDIQKITHYKIKIQNPISELL